MACFVFMLTICLMTFAMSRTEWINEYDKPATFNCPTSYHISFIESQHNNYFEDRVWYFTCSQIQGFKSCEMSAYMNFFRGPLNYECPNRGAIAGIESYHDNKFEDRRFRFKCCNLDESRVNISFCQQTQWLNSLDNRMNYQAPQNTILTGFYSEYDVRKRDRRFKVTVCDYYEI